jgi:hypothetical protein
MATNETFNTVKRLWAHAPILSLSEIARRSETELPQLKTLLLDTGIASKETYSDRQRFISFCLEGNHLKRCKYCGILIYDNAEFYYQQNVSGYCEECFDKFKPRRYNSKISWYRNMMKEDWLPSNYGWQNKVTGVFLPKKYMAFFMENFITP